MSDSDAERPFAQSGVALPDIHTVLRTVRTVGTTTAIGALFLAGLASPDVSRAVGVTFEQGVLVAGVFLSTVVLAYVAFHRYGASSRRYRVCDALEGFTLSWGIAYLIQASSGAHSFFWIFYGVQVFATSLAGISTVYLLTVCAGPAYLTAAFLWQGQTASAWLSALAGVCGLFVYVVVARLTSERDAALRREAALREQLGHIVVARERARISRDLHDNVATELTALVWKVREISDAVPQGPHTAEIMAVAERLRSTIAELRSVVLELRDPEPSFRELKALVERRCLELCGPKKLTLRVEGEVDRDELAVFDSQLVPICFELVHNAARHSRARRIELTLRIAERLHLLVSDDGSGLPPEAWQASRGGLASVQDRVRALRGTATFEATSPGTRVAIELPRPLRLGMASALRG